MRLMERLSTGFVNGQAAEFVETFKNGVLAIYSGTQPASADEAETGTLLCLITKDGGAFTPGQPDNGLNFGTPSGGAVDKDAAEMWSGKALVDGTAGWFRFYDNNYVTGASTTARRFDGAISNLEMNEVLMANTVILVAESELTVDSFRVVFDMD